MIIYDTLNEKRIALIILAYNNDDLIDTDSKYVENKKFNSVCDTEPTTAKQLKQALDKKQKKKKYTQTFSLTLCERSENHKGMQIIGESIEHGLTLKNLKRTQKYFDEKGFTTKLYHLNDLLSEEDVEAVRQHVVVDSVIKNSVIEEQGGKKFVRMANSFVNIDDIHIDLIDQVNPFQKAFEILSKSVTTQVLKIAESKCT